MLLALCGTYLVLKSRPQVSGRAISHFVAGITIGLAVMSRPNYGVPFAFVLLIFLIIEFRLQPKNGIPWHLIGGFISGLGGVFALLGLTDSLGYWLTQSIAGPAKSFLPEFLGWRYAYELYVRDQLILVVLVVSLVIVTRTRLRAISILSGIGVLVVATKYFYISLFDPALTVIYGRDTEFLEKVPDQLSTTIALRSTLIGSVLVGLTLVSSLLKRNAIVRRQGFNRLFEIAPLVACGVGALAQLYPYPDLYHFWWASPPFFILCAVGLSRAEFRSIRLGIFLCVLIPTSVNLAKIREQVAIPRIEWSGGVLDGMLIDRDFYPSFEQAALFLKQVRDPVDFDCREGLWAVFSGDYLAAGPDYVNWAYSPKLVSPNGLIDTVRCADPETAETRKLTSLSSSTSWNDATPLTFSRWSGWFDFYMLKSTEK
jgi:ABC-type Mn2+/Zn2+ transport system permease subunit